MAGTVYRGGKGAPGLRAHVYHADAHGLYALRPGEPPRLCGVMRTDGLG